MSKESVLAFIGRLEQDEALQQKLTGEVDMDRLLSVAGEAGYEFSPEDWQAATAGRELTEQDLEQVAGGLNPQPEPPIYFLKFLKINPVVNPGEITGLKY